MPYIKPEKRKVFKKPLGDMLAFINDEGDLNYVISKLCLKYLRMKEPTSYALLNEIVGVLESAKLEFYRRRVLPYEDVKINENGDI
jgi:hypothetical protein